MEKYYKAHGWKNKNDNGVFEEEESKEEMKEED